MSQLSAVESLVEKALKQPTSLNQKNDSFAALLMQSTKSLFDYGNETTPLCSLPELVVDGFSPDQIWEELQLQNVPLLKQVETTAKELCKAKRLNLVQDENQKKKKKQKQKSKGDQQDAHSDSESDADIAEIAAKASKKKKKSKAKSDGFVFGRDVELDSDEEDEDEEDGEGNAELDAVLGKRRRGGAEDSEGSEGDEEGDEDDLDDLDDEENDDYVLDEDGNPIPVGDLSDEDGEGASDEQGDEDMEDVDEDDKEGEEENGEFGEEEVNEGEESDDGGMEDYLAEQAMDDGDDDNAEPAEDADETIMSNHRKEQLKLERQIKELENKQINKKIWQMTGEVMAKQRPKDSLLEADLEFDQTAKPVPVITEEVTTELEALIKKRITESTFNDVERRIAPLPSAKTRIIQDVADEKSKLSLAQIYEQEYLEKSGAAVLPDVVKKQHDEISNLFKELCYKLDALSNFQFTPKPVLPEFAVRTNVAAIAMEEAVPVGASNASLLAPEEVYEKKRRPVLGETETTTEDRKKERKLIKGRVKKQRSERDAEIKLRDKLRPGPKSAISSTKQAEKQLKANKQGVIRLKENAPTGNVWQRLEDEQKQKSEGGSDKKGSKRPKKSQ